MCNSLLSAVPIRGRQSNRDADMLKILQSGGNKLRQFSYLLGGIPLPRKCQLFELVKRGKLMLCHVLLSVREALYVRNRSECIEAAAWGSSRSFFLSSVQSE